MSKENGRRFTISSKTKYALLSVLIIVLMVVSLFFVQSSLDLLDDNYILRLDLTKEKIYTMTTATRDYVSAITQPVEIIVMSDESMFATTFGQQHEILRTYARLNDNISLEFVNVLYDPQYLNDYADDNIEMGDVLFKCGDRYQIVSYTDLGYSESTDDEDVSIEYSTAESAYNKALVYVICTDTYTVAFTKGHEESSTDAEFRTLLEDNAFTVYNTDLYDDTDLSEVDILVVNSPIKDFTEEELKSIDNFLTNGGLYNKTLVYLSALGKNDTPNLDAFLKEWGLVVEDKVIYEWDRTHYYLKDYRSTYVTVPSTETTYGARYADRTVIDDYKLLVPFCRVVDTLPYVASSVGTITTTDLLVADGAPALISIERALSSNFVRDMSDESTTEYAAAAISVRNVNGYESRVWACGTGNIIHDTAITDPDFVNYTYMLDTFKAWVDRPTPDFDVDPVNLSGDTFSFNSVMETVIVFAVLVVLPTAAVVIVGFVVYRRRKHL